MVSACGLDTVHLLNLLKFNGFMCAMQINAAITKLWPQFPDSLPPLGGGGCESLASETNRYVYAVVKDS